MDISETSLQYFASTIVTLVLQKSFSDYRSKASEPFEQFMQTLPSKSSKPPVTFSSKDEFVEHTEPCLVREAFRSVRNAALRHIPERAIWYEFQVASFTNQEFVACSGRGMRRIRLNLTGRAAQHDDAQWNVVLVLVTTGPVRNAKIQLGFVHKEVRQRTEGNRGQKCLDLWLPDGSPRSPSPGDTGRIAQLTPFMSVYRQCWALSMFLPQPSQSYLYRHHYASWDMDTREAPLMEAFLSLPASSYRSSKHQFGDRHDKMLVNVNETQKRIVKDFAYSVIAEDRKIILGLQGPPGTGKSATIATLVKLLVKAKPGIKILIAAPSNAAVDSVGCRIAALQDALDVRREQKRIETFRAWEKREADRIARHLRKKAEASVFRKLFDFFFGDETAVAEPMPVFVDVSPTYDLVRLGFGEKISIDMKKYSVEERMPNFLKWCGYPAVLNENVRGNIFLSTLNSCASYRVTKIHQLIKFDVVIVDEAGQALQLDTLIPVTILRVKKLILIGDQNQLSATVLDGENDRVDYARSWLERIGMHFENDISRMLPMLDVQYRMHPLICAFPSAEFYRGALKTGPKVIENSKKWKLLPLKFFNLVESREAQDGTSKFNDNEVKFIGQFLAECMTHEGSQQNYAVITGYEAQRSRLVDYLRACHLGNVRVSTVDGFQGQENKVIIISCVRAGRGGIGFLKDRKRLNVALTRAQHSVFIVGHRSTLQAHSIWKNFFNQPNLGKNVVAVPSSYKMSRLVKDHVLKPAQ
ncbi:hypothetical protein RvY_10506 [Ramazzottius varieornatus]|uniref:AAA+ ATPase domain-containing protein n=1 Tax=Ramazzottius varieornatus TaxID=947166 RepID=A0A1D1VCZ3_RAMVA|nr:hypothetical protein RvY_10506 [Ramazzottius varieornatus]